MNPSFSDIKYFAEVAQTQNISRAAERLGLTQPSLSASMQRLEEALGVDLLIRSRSGVQLTQAGKEFLFRSRSLLSQWEQIRSETLKKEKDVSGQYSIGCHPSVALYSLGLFLPDLLARNSHLEIKCEHDLSRKVAEKVISFEIDFGIVVNPVQHPDLVIKELCVDYVRFWSKAKPSKLQDPKSESAVLICDMNLMQIQKLLGKTKKQGETFKRVVTTSSLEVITDLVESGAGIGIIPTRVVDRIGAKSLKALEDWPTFKDRICLIYRADAQQTEASRVITKSIRDAFAKESVD